ncbi:LysR family transcriptional regulator [Sphingopyxis sp. A083]|jgi:DNA-binding transcriptional LysR family regulator|uniref:LysR family transcriptional regulator n=1 Tax=Sphingopyxis sp. A083 TaxID=1759083 RepID=UPI0007379188|nr:LysR family transcriptional regulator [Sphingopyxis sp. A083]KTE77565.1 hypothetical protein ATE59_05150 [Sphingopyxis sp. A083]
MLELDHILCVLGVAETRSFSATAERMGLAQSVVSKRVRRIEEQLGLRIFERTSRSVELTHQGRALLPFAQAVVDAESAARNAARNLHDETANLLVLGTYDFLISFRMELMDMFHAEYPSARIEVVFGSRTELFAGIRTGRLDLAMMAAPTSHFEPDFRSVKLPKRYAHLLVPTGHRLFARDGIEARDLLGLEIVYSPSQQDPLVRAEISGRLVREGAKLVLAPEAHRPSMEHFADIRRLPVLRWMQACPHRIVEEGKAIIPFVDLTLRIETLIYASKTHCRPIAARFLQMAERMRNSLAAG